MATYEIDAPAGILKVAGELGGGEETALRRHCDELLRGGAAELVLDLTGVTSIVSMCVGIIAALWLDAITLERNLVVRPSKEVRRVFHLAGFDRVINLGD